MLILEKLRALESEVGEAVNELFEAARKNQIHENDILLVFLNAARLMEPSQNYLHIGDGMIGLAYRTQYEFINEYRKPAVQTEHEANESGIRMQTFTVHLEMLVYLKFWESDLLIRQLYELALLCQGRDYEWDFEVPGFAREGSKQDILRKEIRDALSVIAPKFSKLIGDSYKTQLRNAFAHSQYYIVHDVISLLNYSEKPEAHSPIPSLKFEEWSNYIHRTLLIHNALIKNLESIQTSYRAQAEKNGPIDVLVRGNTGKHYIQLVPDFRRKREWTFKDNMDKS